jgi:high affinity Mn2+ porin
VRHWLIGSGALVALALAERADADERAPATPLKAPPVAAKPVSAKPSDWSGFYVGGHLGAAWGHSDWSAAGGVPVGGSFDLGGGFNAFKGTGSYFAGLQAGYNAMLPNRILLGAEADISFPNTIDGSQTFSSVSTGTASFAEQVQFYGSVRGRLGYAPGGWLIYATGGFAFGFDHFTRTQLSGTPAGGLAAPGTVESRFMAPRAGWTAGAGVEFALTPHWSARLEYLYTQFNTRSVSFPAGAQVFASDLSLQSLRLGLNYKIGQNDSNDGWSKFLGKGPSPLELDRFAFHGQTTYVHQYAFPFRSPYRGQNSLNPNQGRETWDVTFYAGARLWEGAELWVNPEIDQGFGLSRTLGVAGFPSGEAYKVGESVPYARVPRLFLRQTIDLGGEKQKVEAGINQFAGSQAADRLVITLGKFGVTDVFDTNKYTHDPRSDFMNWALVDTGTFDYAADAWGYTYGAAVEWYAGSWTLRGGLFDLSVVPNSTELDPHFSQFQWIGEIERRHELWGQPGKVAVTGFLSRGRMGRFDDAVLLSNLTGQPADTAAVRRYQSRTGISLNAEQQLSADIGMFARAGMARGDIEPYEFSDIDRTLAAGMTVSGKSWGRAEDTFGLAGIVNSISGQHKAYLNAGGLGILVGDGKLTNPGPEQIIEMYYSLPLQSWRLTFDYQLIANPAYNRDRGPVSIIGTRLRTQFRPL